MEAIPARLVAALAGRYRLERELGAGGAATVYLAEDLKHTRRVAIKVLRPEVAEALGAARFEDEIRIAAGLHHPHILAVHDSGEADGFLYYVMPYVEGQSLREKLQSGTRLPVAQVARILSEVADALGEAHAAGIVHRDIKPENILLAGRHALVADFGVAKAISDASTRKSSTSMGLAIGTPAYMSPEQATADPALDHRADLYALGVVAYEMLAGRTPFEGSSQQILAAHTVTLPEPLSKLRPDIPAALANLVMRALAKSPSDRWQTAEAMQAQLDPLTGNSSSGMTPTTAVPAALRRVPRRTLVLGAAALAGIVAVFAFAAWRVDRDRALEAAAATAVPVATAVKPGAGPVAAAPASAVEKGIAVLPFANLSSDKENAYFADGIQDEIITRLAKIGDLKVISRTSTMRYASNPENLQQIAKELGVANIVQGSVQKVGDSVRINVQLVQAATDTHLWAEIYDRKLVDVFGIQSEVATAIAQALEARLTSDEKQQVASRPTANAAAYDAYLKGLSVEARANFSLPINERALAFYREATRLDPAFVEAWAHQASVQSFLYSNGLGHTPETLAQLKAAAEATAKLRPGSGEALLTAGYYRYRGLRDLPGAAKAFEQAAAKMPNDADVFGVLGSVERRLGRMPAAIAHLQRAAELDPGNAGWLGTLGELLTGLRRYDESRVVLDKALAIAPFDEDFISYKIWSYQAQGNLGAAARLIAALPPLRDGDDRTLGSRAGQLYLERRFAAVMPICQAMLANLKKGVEGERARMRNHMCVGSILRMQGNASGANARYVQAAAVAARLKAAGIDENEGGAYPPGLLAALGRTQEALAVIDKLEAIERGDTKQLPNLEMSRAEILARAGRKDEAIAILQKSIHVPFGAHAAELRLDPTWDMLRGDPRFDALTR